MTFSKGSSIPKGKKEYKKILSNMFYFLLSTKNLQRIY